MMKRYNLDFFLPFEFDQVPKIWDPWNDTWDSSSGKFFISDFFKEPPYDGILISKSKFDDNARKYGAELKEDKDLKHLLKISEDIKLFGDCGAFQYKDKKKPPYTAENVLNYYQDYGFDMGCSIDHIITKEIKTNPKLREERRQITKDFAKECMELYESNKFSFELFGVAQGWDIKSYSEIVRYLYQLGYKNICLGGLVGLRTESKNQKDFTLVKLLKKLGSIITDCEFNKVHLFGRGNVFADLKSAGNFGLKLLNVFQDSRITQFDNNIMIKAYKGNNHSYYLYNDTVKDLMYYTSIRVPMLKNSRKQGLHKDETEIFLKLRQFDEDKITGNNFIRYLEEYYKKYNKHPAKKRIYEFKEKINNTLNDTPWKKCRCGICEKYGIHICVFRRRMRNTLRAFHNVYNYYAYLRYLQSSKFQKEKKVSLADFTGG